MLTSHLEYELMEAVSETCLHYKRRKFCLSRERLSINPHKTTKMILSFKKIRNSSEDATKNYQITKRMQNAHQSY